MFNVFTLGSTYSIGCTTAAYRCTGTIRSISDKSTYTDTLDEDVCTAPWKTGAEETCLRCK